MYVQRNIEARSCNDCCSGQAISIPYSVCVFVVLGIQHAMRIRMSSAACPAVQIFSTLSHKRQDLKKKNTQNVCFDFSTTFVWNISHSKKNWAR